MASLKGTSPKFGRQLDGTVRLMGWTGRDLAARIARDLEPLGLGRTDEVTVSRWRNGHTAPCLAVQLIVLEWLQRQAAGSTQSPSHRLMRSSGGPAVSCSSLRERNMVSKNDRHVVPNPDGGWDVKAPRADRASAHRDTQSQAEDRARAIVRNLGGGEVVTHGRDGRIRDPDTVPKGNDPFPPRDKK